MEIRQMRTCTPVKRAFRLTRRLIRTITIRIPEESVENNCSKTGRRLSPLVFKPVFFLVLLLSFSSFSFAQSFELGSDTVDSTRDTAPKWRRINFTVPASGTHTVRIEWDSSADVRFSLSDATTGTRIATIDSNSPSVWTGLLSANVQYFLSVWSASGGVADYTATLEAEAQTLSITSQPLDLTVAEGDDASFGVVASGAGTLSYQWFVNDQVIVGATTDTLTLVSVGLADNGTVFRVDVADDNSTVSSEEVTLTVEEFVPLVIATQPVSVTVTEGDDAGFSVSASGDGSLAYQWFSNNQAIAGATSDTLVLATVNLADNGTVYRVDVTDENSLVSSDEVVLTVEEIVPLVITAQPVGMAVIEGDSASFGVVATGDGTLTYQWFANDQLIVGSTADVLSLTSAGLSDSGTVYRVDVADNNSVVSSNSVTLIVEPLIPVTAVTVGQGTLDSNLVAAPRFVRINFDALATANHTITVSWDSDADLRFNIFDSNNNRLNNLTLQGVNPGIWSGDLVANEQYNIRLWSTNGIGNYTVAVEATVPLSFDSQPRDLIVTEGEDAFFSVAASGSGPFSYQWLADGSPIVGENDDHLTIFAASLFEDGTEYSVQISNSVETVTSNTATLTVNEPIVLGLFSTDADQSTWLLEGPAPTLDNDATTTSDGWGQELLRVGDLLLVGGDFVGIRPTRGGVVTSRPFLAALDATTGQPVSNFQTPFEVSSVVRTLALSPDGNTVYAGGNFGFIAMDAVSGELIFAIDVADGVNEGRVFDIAVTQTHVYIGGDFSHIDDSFRANIARFSLDGVLDDAWRPFVTSGHGAARAAPVQSVTVSPDASTVYVGGNFRYIDGTPVETTPQGLDISILTLNASDGSVRPERFAPFVNNSTKAVVVHDIVVTEFYVIIAWGGPNFLSFHALDGTRLQQYNAKGDVQALQVVGDHVFVGHHGEFFGFLPNTIPPEAVLSLEPEIIESYKFHSFRIDDPTFPPEQAWQITGKFGVWGIAAAEDSVWIAGQISRAGSNGRTVDGLARFPAID